MIDTSTELNELATALAAAQATIQAAIKDAENPHFRSKYADLPAVWEACRKPLTDHGLSVVQLPIDSEPGRIALMTMLLHKSGQFIRSTVSTRIVKDDPQGVGSGLTYLRRYALAAAVGVVADVDDDGNAASEHPQHRQQSAQHQQQHTHGTGGMSQKQRDYLNSLMDQLDWTRSSDGFVAAAKRANVRLDQSLSSFMASALIKELERVRDGQRDEVAA